MISHSLEEVNGQQLGLSEIFGLASVEVEVELYQRVKSLEVVIK